MKMRSYKLITLIVITTIVGLSACRESKKSVDYKPIVISHRGASGYLPEHTLAGYQMAIEMGADYIEPDLQFSSDGALIAMHDETLDRTTNVADLFDKRNGSYKVSDFTLAEIKTLTVHPIGTARESYPDFAPSVADPWQVPTFQEVIELARSPDAGREVGIYPEVKQKSPLMEDGILQALVKNQYSSKSKVYIQFFSPETLRSLRAKLKTQKRIFPQILLGSAITEKNGTSRVGIFDINSKLVALDFNEITDFAEGIGLNINSAAAPLSKKYIEQAHAAGLEGHGWTFTKADPTEANAEYRKYLEIGIDGVFSNYPDLAVSSRDAFIQSH